MTAGPDVGVLAWSKPASVASGIVVKATDLSGLPRGTGCEVLRWPRGVWGILALLGPIIEAVVTADCGFCSSGEGFRVKVLEHRGGCLVAEAGFIGNPAISDVASLGPSDGPQVRHHVWSSLWVPGCQGSSESCVGLGLLGLLLLETPGVRNQLLYVHIIQFQYTLLDLWWDGGERQHSACGRCHSTGWWWREHVWCKGGVRSWDTSKEV